MLDEDQQKVDGGYYGGHLVDLCTYIYISM